MKGYRSVCQKEFDMIIGNRGRITPGAAQTHRDCANTLEKSRTRKCFWFFEELADAIDWAWANNLEYIVEVDIPSTYVYEQGFGGYYGTGINPDLVVPEFTTLELWADQVTTYIDRAEIVVTKREWIRQDRLESGLIPSWERDQLEPIVYSKDIDPMYW